MDTRTQDVPGYYVWEAPGGSVTAHIKLDVVDRLSAEVMRGFGAVRKRGAEIGGLLLGSVEEGFPALVRVDDYLTVPCEYRRGPSYLFTEEDSAAFEEAYQANHPIGYFRSHTRDGFELCDDDVQLLDHFFPSGSNIALLIRPYATKTSTAGVFVRGAEHFERTTQLEFPFNRASLTGALESQPETPSGSEEASLNPVASISDFTGYTRNSHSDSLEPYPTKAPEVRRPESVAPRFKGSRQPASWIWIPLSFLFLFLGAVLGFEAARSTFVDPPSDEYKLSLGAAKSGSNITIRWGGRSRAVKAARKGQLVIEDGDTKKTVDLDLAQLRNGTLVYHNSTSKVQLYLSVFPRTGVAVTESVEWSEQASR